MEVKINTFNSESLGVEVPEKVTLEVVECEPGVKGNTASNATKSATVSTGYSLQVPLFVEVGDKLIINTNDGRLRISRIIKFSSLSHELVTVIRD